MEQIVNKIHLKGDKIIWSVIILLFLFSALVIFASADCIAADNGYKNGPYFYFIQHLGFFAGGFILMFTFHRFPVSLYKNVATLALIISICLLLYTIIYGTEVNGAKRWIEIAAGIRFQPAEIAKISVVLYLASVLEDNVFDDFRDVVKKIVVPIGTICLLVFIEGTSIGLLFGVICMSILFIGGLKLKFFSKILGLTLIVLVILCISGITTGWPNRIVTAANRLGDFSFILIVSFLGITGTLILLFASSKLKYLGKICGLALAALTLLFFLGLAFRWSPAVTVADKIENIFKSNDKSTGITQADIGKIAVASGGFVGKAPGNSSQRYLLPFSYSDFVFAIIVEEYGLVTGSLILLIYMVLLYRAAIIAKKCTRIFSSVTVLGLMLMIVFQAMVNMGVSVGIFPVTGQTLPFVSYGGTSLLCTGITFGIILSISRAANNQEIAKHEDGENETKYKPNNASEKITEYNE